MKMRGATELTALNSDVMAGSSRSAVTRGQVRHLGERAGHCTQLYRQKTGEQLSKDPRGQNKNHPRQPAPRSEGKGRSGKNVLGEITRLSIWQETDTHAQVQEVK